MDDHEDARADEESVPAVPTKAKTLYARLGNYFAIFDTSVSRLKMLAWVVSGVIIPVTGYFYACYGHTKTSFSVVDADPYSIKVNVSSKGPAFKWSTLRGYQLTFGNVPVEAATLRIVNDKGDGFKGFISPGKPVTLLLTADGLRPRCRQTAVIDLPDRYTKSEIEPLIDSQEVKLTISVQESNDPETGPFTKVPQPFPALRIEPFLAHNLPDHIPAKSCS